MTIDEIDCLIEQKNKIAQSLEFARNAINEANRTLIEMGLKILNAETDKNGKVHTILVGEASSDGRGEGKGADADVE